MRFVKNDTSGSNHIFGTIPRISEILGVKGETDKGTTGRDVKVNLYLKKLTEASTSYQSSLISGDSGVINEYHKLFDQLLKTVGVVITHSKKCCVPSSSQKKRLFSIESYEPGLQIESDIIVNDEDFYVKLRSIKSQIDFLDKLNGADIKCLCTARFRQLPTPPPPPPPEFI